jgi:uncharacterized membrane protein YeaQ/YmgE (transglycosylase-associated protein family)
MVRGADPHVSERQKTDHAARSMSSLASLLQFVPFGLLIGALARALTKGRGRVGWAPSMLVGAAGALLGAILGRAFVLVRDEAPMGFVASLLGALFLVAAHQAFLRPRLQAVRPSRP